MDLKKYKNYFHNPYKRNSNLFLNNNITEQKINNDEMFDTRKVVTQEVNKLISKNNIVNDKKKILNTINLDLPQLNENTNIIQIKIKEIN